MNSVTLTRDRSIGTEPITFSTFDGSGIRRTLRCTIRDRACAREEDREWYYEFFRPAHAARLVVEWNKRQKQ
jgi:hypothetical protein